MHQSHETVKAQKGPSTGPWWAWWHAGYRWEERSSLAKKTSSSCVSMQALAKLGANIYSVLYIYIPTGVQMFNNEWDSCVFCFLDGCSGVCPGGLCNTCQFTVLFLHPRNHDRMLECSTMPGSFNCAEHCAEGGDCEG